MEISKKQQKTIEQVINCFETGKPKGVYDKVSIYSDAPGGERQVTYGKSQTTEHGQLKQLLQSYVHRNGAYATQLAQYIPQIKKGVLHLDKAFIAFLRTAGKSDPIMRECQDALFYNAYYIPAINWAEKNGFTYPLSILVIYDSFIHSGGMKDFLMNRFSEKKPVSGGIEKHWISEYVRVRKHWLANHLNPVLRPTVYRMNCFNAQIDNGNWELDQRPILANGIYIRD